MVDHDASTDSAATGSAAGFSPLATDRLLIRGMRTDDAPAFAAYRNDPETARHQDWAVPFSADDAVRFVEKQVATVWPVSGDWVQLAVARDGELIGDVGVCQSSDGMQAQIGYTLAPAHRGEGFATEAVGAVIDLLFAEGVHRVWATLDPENTASARVLERLGFRFEGRSAHAAYVRGEWSDDLRYALLVDERSEWLARPRHRPEHVVLIEIDWRNSGDVLHLATHHSQERFVATVYQSFADALTPDLDEGGGQVVPWFRAIGADGELTGFIMVAGATATNPDPFLWRLLIDRRHQGRGIGHQAIAALADRLRDEGHRRLLTSWVPGRGSPEGFYLRLGFVPTGQVLDGEVVSALELHAPDASSR
jgi:RimJ/RimL family protein N-acetyltransferase